MNREIPTAVLTDAPEVVAIKVHYRRLDEEHEAIKLMPHGPQRAAAMELVSQAKAALTMELLEIERRGAGAVSLFLGGGDGASRKYASIGSITPLAGEQVGSLPYGDNSPLTGAALPDGRAG